MAIKKIAIIHHTHTDFGYTDHPNRAMIDQVGYIDRAIDYVLKSSDYPEKARFAWTQEQLHPVRLWWETADEEKKQRFFEAVKTGRFEITGSPFNVTAFMDENEWETALNWVSDDLLKKCNVKSIMQIDVNGMHTAGMVIAHKKGVENLFMGPNSYYGAAPMPTPAAFNWQIDEQRQMFVWINSAYNNGTYMFNENWRQGPVPAYSDLRYREPEKDDFWASDDESIKKAHEMCLKSIKGMESSPEEVSGESLDGFTKYRVSGNYPFEVLPVSVTNQWRFDNDPPFYPIVDFVKRWNELGLKPELELCTVTDAMEMVKAEMGENIPVYSGEWVDWWANGNASLPVESAFSRKAKRTLKTLKSPLFGEIDEQQKKTIREISEDICLYDEHSFGSWQSVSDPNSFSSLSQEAEKKVLVYRALDSAECLLAERVRALTDNVKNKIVVFNAAKKPKTVTVELPLNCMRGDYHSVRCDETGEIFPIEYTAGIANFLRPASESEFGPENVSHTFSDNCENQGIKFGPVMMAENSRAHFTPLVEKADESKKNFCEYSVKTDENGWPIYFKFEGQSKAAVNGAFGDFLAVKADGFAPRWTFRDIFENDNAQERAKLREEHIYEVWAQYGAAEKEIRNGNVVFTQPIIHDSLIYGKRVAEFDLINKVVDFEVRMNRKFDYSPEVLFMQFDAPENNGLPYISNAGKKFKPEAEQLKGSCMDFYAFDGWVRYPDGWMLNSIDSALITFGSHSVVSRKTETNGPINKIYIRLFDNLWDTNFCANANGLMNFKFNVKADVLEEETEIESETMSSEPIVVVKMGYKN